MKLENKQVQFVSSFMSAGFQAGVPRFFGKEKSVHLRETAFVIEGQALKVSFPIVDMFVRSALSDTTSLTIPYQRMRSARLIRWPFSRLLFLILLLLVPVVIIWFNVTVPFNPASADMLTFVYILAFVVGLLSLYLVFRIKPRYEIVFRDKNHIRRQLNLRIKNKVLSKQFDVEITRYIQEAKGFEQASLPLTSPT